jgi:hypothetical protein
MGVEYASGTRNNAAHDPDWGWRGLLKGLREGQEGAEKGPGRRLERVDEGLRRTLEGGQHEKEHYLARHGIKSRRSASLSDTEPEGHQRLIRASSKAQRHTHPLPTGV